MPKMWFYIRTLVLLFFPCVTSAASLPPSLQPISNLKLLSNGSQHYIQCLPKSNVTYPIYDSPLDLAMTFGHRPILSWQVITFLEDVLASIRSRAAHHPHEYMPDGYFYYHVHDQLGTISVIPSFVRNFTWSDLYLVLHGLAEYVVAAPHAYEMCVEIVFRAGGLAGVIYFNWWTPDFGSRRHPVSARDAGHLPNLEMAP